MSFSDFKSNFTNLEICNLSPAPLLDDEHEGNDEEHSHCNKHWEETIFEGSWISGVSAGGCRNYLQTYAMVSGTVWDLMNSIVDQIIT